jgi:hypothetical protein
MRYGLGKIFAAAVLALAACADASYVGVPYYSGGYAIGEELAAGPDMPVVVRGNPFAMPQPAFDAAVADAMTGWAFGLPLRFVPVPESNAVYRVIMVFNPPAAVADHAYCVRPLRIDAVFGLPPEAARTPVFAIFCRGDAVLASSSGSLGTAGGPMSPPFREGVGQFTAALFPPANPETQPDRCLGVFC